MKLENGTALAAHLFSGPATETDLGCAVLLKATYGIRDGRLEPATEARVQQATERLLAGRIGILIAHRLSTVAHCDDVAPADFALGLKAELLEEALHRRVEIRFHGIRRIG